MSRRYYYLASLTKSTKYYASASFAAAVNWFNQSQKNLYLELEHYDLDRFICQFSNNKLKLGYMTYAPSRVYYDIADDFERNNELMLRETQNIYKQEPSYITYLNPTKIALWLNRFGPTFNSNGIVVAQAAQQLGIEQINAPQGLSICRDKWSCYQQLVNLAPLVNSSLATWQSYKNLPKNALTFPRISKPHKFTFAGNNVKVALNAQQLSYQSYQLAEYDFTLSQDFIQTHPKHSYDLRIIVLGGLVTGSFIRISQKDKVVANISQGGLAVPYQITPQLQQQAQAIAQHLGLEICGLDYIYNNKLQQWQLLEANAAPGCQGYDLVHDKSFAHELLDMILYRLTGFPASYFLNTKLDEDSLNNLQQLSSEQARQAKERWQHAKDCQQLQLFTQLVQEQDLKQLIVALQTRSQQVEANSQPAATTLAQSPTESEQLQEQPLQQNQVAFDQVTIDQVAPDQQQQEIVIKSGNPFLQEQPSELATRHEPVATEHPTTDTTAAEQNNTRISDLKQHLLLLLCQDVVNKVAALQVILPANARAQVTQFDTKASLEPEVYFHPATTKKPYHQYPSGNPFATCSLTDAPELQPVTQWHAQEKEFAQQLLAKIGLTPYSYQLLINLWEKYCLEIPLYPNASVNNFPTAPSPDAYIKSIVNTN